MVNDGVQCGTEMEDKHEQQDEMLVVVEVVAGKEKTDRYGEQCHAGFQCRAEMRMQ